MFFHRVKKLQLIFCNSKFKKSVPNIPAPVRACIKSTFFYKKLYILLFATVADAIELLEKNEPKKALTLLKNQLINAEELYIDKLNL